MIVLLGHTEQLLNKTTPSRLQEVVTSPNTYRQTQRDRQNEETEEYMFNTIDQGESPEKDLNKTEMTNLKEFQPKRF